MCLCFTRLLQRRRSGVLGCTIPDRPKGRPREAPKYKGSRVDGTCIWIKNNAIYNSWFCSHSQLLWLSGGPGKGKTMLSIFLAKELEQTAKHSQNTLFLQYFCDNKDEKRNTAMVIVRGLIYQLLQLRPKLFHHILPSFEIQKESLFIGSSFETLWRIFETMLHDSVLGSAYCILDGLDECDKDSLEVLLKKFRALFSTTSSEYSACHLKLIVVSRDLPDFIPEILSSFPRIQLDPDADTEVNNDIHRFIEVKVDELSTYRRYPEQLRVHVKEVFQNRAQGTFLWVGIVAELLRKYKATEVEKALDLFPSGLEEVYARILLQIDIGRREIATKMLRWVVMAVRPLTLSELSIAIETTVGPSVVAFSRDEVIKDQVSYCGYLLTIRDDEVGLIHQSAKDYLLRRNCDSNPELEVFRVKAEVGNLEIARKCFDYLQNGALTDGKIDLLKNTAHLKAFPLLSYAALHWSEHARSLARSEDIFNLSLPFYHKKSRLRTSWLRTYWAAKGFREPPSSFTLLHLASFFGILPLTENLLLQNGLLYKVQRLLCLDEKDGWERTALHWAAQGGHEAVARLLLDKWANIEAKDECKDTALHLTASKGHDTVVRLLLNKGIDTEARNIRRKTALHCAVYNRHEAVVRLLLDKGANIKAKDESEMTALHLAASRGQEAVVRLLLNKGADVEAEDKFEKTALLWAAGGGYEAVVRLLLDMGANIEAKSESKITALHQAALFGREATVRLLLNKGADVEVKNWFGETALHVAVSGGHKTVVQLLLDKGANIEAKIGAYESTALHRAASKGHEAIIRLLLSKGADVEAEDTSGEIALELAARYGHKTVVQLLLDKGANERYSAHAVTSDAYVFRAGGLV